METKVKKIKYTVECDENRGEYCTTRCPLGKSYMTIAICVGSGECHRCRRFISDDLENQVVTCKGGRKYKNG